MGVKAPELPFRIRTSTPDAIFLSQFFARISIVSQILSETVKHAHCAYLKILFFLIIRHYVCLPFQTAYVTGHFNTGLRAYYFLNFYERKFLVWKIQ
jgi:hypothetical protein